jgi:hypothetical protein
MRIAPVVDLHNRLRKSLGSLAMKKLHTVTLLTLAALYGSAGCVLPEDENLIFIRGAVAIEPPNCEVNAGTQLFLSGGLLDIGDDLTDANSYTNAFIVENTLKEERVSIDQAEIKFETDVNQQLEGDATPGGGAAPRKTFAGGLVDPGGKAVVFVNTVSEDDARSLQTEPLVTNAGLNTANPERSVRIIARVSIEGHTTYGGLVKTPFYSFPLSLCSGCLTQRLDDTSCPNGVAVNETCNFGQDIPFNTCQ